MATVIFQDKFKDTATRKSAGDFYMKNGCERQATPYSKEKNERILKRLYDFVPGRIMTQIAPYLLPTDAISLGRLEEIRLRRGRRVYLTVGTPSGKRNLVLDQTVGESEMSEIFARMCDGSLYAYGESIIKGYVSVGEGIRVGVCGRASVDGGRILGVYDPSALNIRIPCADVVLEEALVSFFRESIRCGRGVLIYSPPAQGKTTLLRALALALSGGGEPMRVSLVDSRDELGSFSGHAELSLDVLCGYPKAEAINIATAFMNPEVIICDEIGMLDEVKSICAAQNCGVPLIASAHADKIQALLCREAIRELHASCAFGSYVGIKISRLGRFDCEFFSREEVEQILANDRTASDTCLRSGVEHFRGADS